MKSSGKILEAEKLGALTVQDDLEDDEDEEKGTWKPRHGAEEEDMCGSIVPENGCNLTML